MPPDSGRLDLDPAQIRVLSEQVRGLRERLAEQTATSQRDAERLATEAAHLRDMVNAIRTDLEVLRMDKELRSQLQSLEKVVTDQKDHISSNRELILKLVFGLIAAQLTAIGALISALWDKL